MKKSIAAAICLASASVGTATHAETILGPYGSDQCSRLVDNKELDLTSGAIVWAFGYLSALSVSADGLAGAESKLSKALGNVSYSALADKIRFECEKNRSLEFWVVVSKVANKLANSK